MRTARQKIASLLLLVTFVVMGFGAYGFSSAWLAHEIDHAQQASGEPAGHAHLAPLDAGSTSHSEPLSDAEHQLLHAYSHADPFVSPVVAVSVESTGAVAPARRHLPPLREPALASPFRPPRPFGYS